MRGNHLLRGESSVREVAVRGESQMRGNSQSERK